MSGSISQEEQDRRREAWRQAYASIRIEGGDIRPEHLALRERWIVGELTQEEVRAELHKILGIDRQK